VFPKAFRNRFIAKMNRDYGAALLKGSAPESTD
jgi:hypothetical protein